MHTIKSFTSLHFFLLLSFFLISCKAPTNTENQVCTDVRYFSTIPLRESPYPDPAGIVPLSEEVAKKRNHYRFEYDQQQRLSSVSFRLGNTLRAPNHTANYFFTTPLQKFEYSEKREVRTFYDRFENPDTQRGVFREIYELDEDGRKNHLFFEDVEGNKIENNWGISDYYWKHQKDGSVIETRTDMNGEFKSLRPGFEFYRIRLCYEQNGILALMQNIDSAGMLIENNSGVAQDKLLFDQEGRWLGWNVLDSKHEIKRGNGPNVARGINLTDEYGYERSLRFEDVDGSPLVNSHGFWGSKRFYDKFGNYDYTYFTDSLLNPGINRQSGYCYADYTWDKSGLLRLKVELLDTDKNPILHKTGGYAVITYEYDDRNNLVRTSYLGLNGEKINRKDNGVSYISYEYDTTNDRTTTQRFDMTGVAVE